MNKGKPNHLKTVLERWRTKPAVSGENLTSNLRIMLVFSLLVFLCLGKPSFQGWPLSAR
jgi:hypothetical protein